MLYPSIDEVEKASRLQLCKWYRFLPLVEGSNQGAIMKRIVERLDEFGGFTPEISKQIGWIK